jgi:hypothetical protein
VTTNRRAIVRSLLIGLTVSIGSATPSHAQTGSVSVVFSKAGFVAGIGGGNGLLIFRGKRYPFKVAGTSLGATLGISTNKLTGYAHNLHRPDYFAGAYTAFGAGGAVAVGASTVRLQNANGVEPCQSADDRVLVLRNALSLISGR